MRNIGIIGGTGPQGRGLAHRFARAGHPVAIGSRSAERSAQTAQELNARLGGGTSVRGTTNAGAARSCDIAVLAVPFQGFAEVLRDLEADLADKIVICCVNPLGFDRQGAHGLYVPEGSAAEQAAAALGGSAVAAAFHNVSAVRLRDEPGPLDDTDILVAGDDVDAKSAAMELSAAVTGRTGIDAGALRNARVLEQLTAVLIAVNKNYRVSAGIALSGLAADVRDRAAAA
ncbi:NADPH-dependent F420 reductase [Actinacidiphila bryophytorum]|uniref:NADPH-dependent F420 reductase n=1 Tax=Actinacidiphila bryophytorum TaxID=1436133 RepID=UPI002176EEAC|nr:NADPH-dependent F420 reductase [Actinacidiphila bryophytorum]UWE09227.1 NADPH-dependent F420 reductase [Actinacidiphila bryophytorum]